MSGGGEAQKNHSSFTKDLTKHKQGSKRQLKKIFKTLKGRSEKE